MYEHVLTCIVYVRIHTKRMDVRVNVRACVRSAGDQDQLGQHGQTGGQAATQIT